jgi:hypothetical protein
LRTVRHLRSATNSSWTAPDEAAVRRSVITPILLRPRPKGKHERYQAAFITSVNAACVTAWIRAI